MKIKKEFENKKLEFSNNLNNFFTKENLKKYLTIEKKGNLFNGLDILENPLKIKFK